ncbi:MAG: DUF2017 domain-containing protein [Acidimicrobiia bacterium]|nr:DUF2017 domain-containing protein [Acidimicrobiia bacterium]
MSRRFTRKGSVIRCTLSEPERELLRELPDQLRSLYASDDPDDAVTARLFPRAYLDPTEEAAEQEWIALVRPELLRSKLAALELVVAALESASPNRRGRLVVNLSDDDVAAFLGVLNDARLALGTTIGVTDDLDLSELDPSDPESAAYAAYGWLTYLEGELVETLLGTMPG